MALDFTHLTTAYDTAAVGDGAAYTTASHTVAGGKVVLACLLVAAGVTADSFTVSGHGTTWNLEEDFVLTDANRRIYVWWGVPPAESTGTISFTKGTGANTTGGGWSIVELIDADTTTPIIQSVPAEAASGTTFAITLAAAADAANRSFGFEFKGANELQAPDANHTELGEAQGASPNMGVQSQYATSAFQTSVGWSTATSSGIWGGVALEIAAAATGPSGTAAIAATVAISATGKATNKGTAAIAVAVALSPTGKATNKGTAAIAGSVALSATGKATNKGTAAIAAAVAISASGSVAGGPLTGTATIATAVVLSATGKATNKGTAAITTAVSVSATGLRINLGGGALDVSVSISATGTATRKGQAAIMVAVGLSAQGPATVVTGQAAIVIEISHIIFGRTRIHPIGGFAEGSLSAFRVGNTRLPLSVRTAFRYKGAKRSR